MTQTNESRDFQSQVTMPGRSRPRPMSARGGQGQRGQLNNDWFKNIQKVEQDLQDSVLELEAAISEVVTAEDGQYDYHAVNAVKQSITALKDAQIELLAAQTQFLSKKAA